MERRQKSEDRVLDFDQVADQQPLPRQRVRAQVVGYDVVDVLDVDQIGLQTVEVVDERSVPTGPKEQTAVVRAKRSVFQVDRQRVRGALLHGKLDLESGRVAPFVGGANLVEEGAETVEVLRGNRHVHAAHAVGIAHPGSRLDEVFLKRRPAAVGVAVELEHALGPSGVIEPAGCEQILQDRREVSARRQCAQIQAVARHDRLQVGEEGESLDPLDENQHLAGVAVSRCDTALHFCQIESARHAHRQEGLKHAACGAGGGDEPREAAVPTRLAVAGLRPRRLVGAEHPNSISNPARSFDRNVGRGLRKDSQLSIDLLLRESEVSQLLEVRWPKHGRRLHSRLRRTHKHRRRGRSSAPAPKTGDTASSSLRGAASPRPGDSFRSS